MRSAESAGSVSIFDGPLGALAASAADESARDRATAARRTRTGNPLREDSIAEHGFWHAREGSEPLRSLSSHVERLLERDAGPPDRPFVEEPADQRHTVRDAPLR